MKINCQHCGKEFEAVPSRLKHGRGRNCSRDCQYAANRVKLRKSIERTCIGCGAKFGTPLSKLNRKGGGKYCNRACRDKHWRGDLNPLWRGVGKSHKYGSDWQAIKRAARDRDGCCQHCGTTDELHVHHKIPFRLFADTASANDLDNLMTLCASCHRTEEAKSFWVPVDGGVLRLSSGGYALELARERGMV